MEVLHLNSEQLRQIPPEKLHFILQFIESAKNKSQEELIPLLFSTYQTMEKQGITLTKKESQLLIDVLSQQMTPAQRHSLSLIQQFL